VPEVLQPRKNGDKTILQVVFGFTFIFGIPQTYTVHPGSQYVVQPFAGPVIPRNTRINYFPEVFQTGFKIFIKSKDNYRLSSFTNPVPVFFRPVFIVKMVECSPALRQMKKKWIQRNIVRFISV
jgi:hypothetical protein